MYMKSLIAAVLWIFGSLSAAPATEWQTETVESMSLAVPLKKAYTTNEQGQRFQLTRGPAGPIFAIFELDSETVDELGADDPLYRVDENPTRSLADYGQFLNMGSKRAEWRIWDGNGDPCKPSSPKSILRGSALCEIMDGQKITFKYFTTKGESRKANFSLECAKEAIAYLLD